jgi:hypothetical protein
MISARTSSILSLVRRYQSLAQVHEAASKLEATLGLEPKISSLDDISLTDLTALIEKSLNQWPAKTATAPEDSPEKSPMGFRLAFGNAVSPAPIFQWGTAPVAAREETLTPLLASLGLSSRKVINGR